MSNAFAPIVRARPNPIFGRPVHQGSPPIDYSPILLLKPFGFRIAPDTLSSDENLVGQRGITPAFGYSAPHPSAGGTLTLLIHALPSAYHGPLRHPSAPGLSLAGVRLIIPDHAMGLPVLRALSLCTCCRHYPGAASGRRLRSSHPAVSAFPGRVAGSACTSSFSRYHEDWPQRSARVQGEAINANEGLSWKPSIPSATLSRLFRGKPPPFSSL